MLPTQTTSIVLYKTFEANVNFKPGASFNVFQLNDLYKVLLSLSLGWISKLIEPCDCP